MKKFVLSTVAVAFGLLALSTGKLQAAFVNTNAMLVQFQITAVTQTADSPVMVTNLAGVVTTTYKTAITRLNSKSILSMLELEFGFPFPAGAQLAYGITGSHPGFQVVDVNGNFTLDVSSNPNNGTYVFSTANNLAGVSVPSPITGRLVSDPVSDNQSTVTPDYGVFYRDGQGNDFHIAGVLTFKKNTIQVEGKTFYKTASFNLSGGGGGTFFNPKTGVNEAGTFTRAVWIATGRNIRE